MRFDIVARDGIGMWSCDKDVSCDVMFQIVLFVVYTALKDRGLRATSVEVQRRTDMLY